MWAVLILARADAGDSAPCFLTPLWPVPHSQTVRNSQKRTLIVEELVVLLWIFPFNPISALILSSTFAAGALNKQRRAKERNHLVI